MYKAYITTDYYKYSEKEEALVWASELEKEKPHHKLIAEAKTLEECKEKALNECEGSRWIFYPSLWVEDQEGSWVYEDIASLYECKCCGKQEWERITM